MTDIRDTKFQGFAELLFRDLSRLGLVALVDVRNFPDNLDRAMELQDEMNQLTKQIFARHAYDLAVHVLTQQLTNDYDSYPESSARQSIKNDIADLTQSPESPDSE